MQVVILCGGMGTRLKEETETKPKPLVEIGGKPILVHIMEGYISQGYNKFILCLGYKGELIREYFYNKKTSLTCEILFVDTGEKTLTGGRVKLIEKYIEGDTFFLTYGDGVSNVDINKTLKYHQKNNKVCTVTGVHPILKYGVIKINNKNVVTGFSEKPVLKDWINGGFFVCNKKLFKYIEKDCTLEKEPFAKIVKDKQMIIYKHEGFWHCMDTYKDMEDLNKLYNQPKVPWIIKK
jgi:glucose-1-phosphate cytidylyltransferase